MDRYEYYMQAITEVLGLLILIQSVDLPECAISFLSYLMWMTYAFGDLMKFINYFPKC